MICEKCKNNYTVANFFNLCGDCLDELLNTDSQHANDQYLEDLFDNYMEDDDYAR